MKLHNLNVGDKFIFWNEVIHSPASAYLYTKTGPDTVRNIVGEETVSIYHRVIKVVEQENHYG